MSRVLGFVDPHRYRAALRETGNEIFVTQGAEFRAELTQIDLPTVWLQRGRETLARIIVGAVTPGRAAFTFLSAAGQPPIHLSGMAVLPGEIAVNDCCPAHWRTEGPSRWGTACLKQDDLVAAFRVIVGRDIDVPRRRHVARPRARLVARVVRLSAEAARLARTAPEQIAHPKTAHAIDQAFVHALVCCLAEDDFVDTPSATARRAVVIARLDGFLAENQDKPLYIAEICAATGASERTLRAACLEHLGMSALRYLWLRRMHMARRNLLVPLKSETVTEIATDCGFWELGRFSVEYHKLFGETPSVSLMQGARRPRRSFAASP
jgi:AraC-like DNA-binding protein